MITTEKAGLLVLLTDGTEIASHDFKLGVLANVVGGHLEDAEMEIRQWGEGAASYEDYRSLGRIPKDSYQTFARKLVVCQRVGAIAFCLGVHCSRLAAGVDAEERAKRGRDA